MTVSTTESPANALEITPLGEGIGAEIRGVDLSRPVDGAMREALNRALADLKQAGFWLVGAVPDARDSLYDLPDRLLAGDLVVVLGAEGAGLRPSVLEALDHPVHIPMRGRVASLNVSAAASALLFELLRRGEARARPGAANPGPSPE